MGSLTTGTSRGWRGTRYLRDAVAITVAVTAGLFAWRAAFPNAGRAERPTQLLIAALILAGAVIAHQFCVRRREQKYRSAIEAKLHAEVELSRAKDLVMAGISSELRAPLTSIQTFSEYLLNHGSQTAAETREIVSMINRDSSHVSHMIEDLLAAARLSAGTLHVESAPVDLVAIAEEEADRFRRHETSIQVHSQHTSGWADRTLVRHVIRNLVTNAVCYGNGKVDIVVTTRGGESSITVSDNGPGFAGGPPSPPPKDDSRGEGPDPLLMGSSTLGLDVARALTEVMGGSLRHERRLGWTHLIVVLPKAPSDPIAETLAERREQDEAVPAARRPDDRELVTIAERFATSPMTFEER